MHLHHYSPNKTISHKLWMHRKTAEGQEDNRGIRRLILFVGTGNEAKKYARQMLAGLSRVYVSDFYFSSSRSFH